MIISSLLLCSSTTLAQEEPEKKVISDIVEPFLKDKPYMGLVIGITRPTGHTVYSFGKVTLNGEEQSPTGDTIFEIGSLTKVFAGTLLADQVIQGKMKLDDPVQKYVPKEWKIPRRDDRDITLLHLATHTSSLPVQPPLLGFMAFSTKDPSNPYAEFDYKKLAQTFKGLKLTRAIGSRVAYSNLGVGLLGHALAQAAKVKNFEQLLVQRIANPLKMSDTRFQLSEKQLKRLPQGHNDKGKKSSPWTFATLEAAGGLRSTVNDLLKFADAALGRQETSLDKAFHMAHDTWREMTNKGESIGLCWMQQQLSRREKMYWHNGGTGGYRSFFAIFPKSDTGIVFLSNATHPLEPLSLAVGKKLLDKD